MGRIFIIAEAGVNHNGCAETARRLIDTAVKCGADAVKFQTFKTEKLLTPEAMPADYQKENVSGVINQMELIKNLELSCREFSELREYCENAGIMFMTTPDEYESADFVENLVSIYKTGSGEVTNIPFIEHIASKGKPLIVSTGMSTLAEVALLVSAAKKVQKGFSFENFPALTLLQCTSNYPASFPSVNLRAMLTMREAFNVPVGFSDHTPGVEASVAAAALGASVIEKHFTLDKTMAGPDHKASLEPDELAVLVRSVRNVEAALGDGVKRPAPEEEKIRPLVRKSLVSARDLKRGEALSKEMIAYKRPGTGISPAEAFLYIGRLIKRNIPADTVIKPDFLE